MAPKQLKRTDLKVLYFPLDPANEEIQGCSIVHRPTGFGAVSEAATLSARDNLLAALTQIAQKMGVDPTGVTRMFQCPTCNQEHLPLVEGWTPEHTYQYSKKVTVSLNKQVEAMLWCFVSREVDDSKWSWALVEGEEQNADPIEYGEEFFIEDAFTTADKCAAVWANERNEEWVSQNGQEDDSDDDE
jgi:antitoxin component of RelBE/YafQ-DinJ toxin-antitoxin module